MDHLRLAHAVPASVRTENLGKWFPPWTVKRQTWSEPLKRISGVSTCLLLYSECGHPLVHHYRVSTKGISHFSYLDDIRTFIMQSEAVGRWGQDKDTAQLSPVHRGSAAPRSIRQRDSDEESPCCKARQARSPRKMDVPAVPMSSTSVSSRDLHSLIYDGRPAIMPVSIRMVDLVGDDAIMSVDLPSVIAHPGKDGVLQVGPTSMRDSEPEIMSEFLSDTDPDLEDELDFSHCRRQYPPYLRRQRCPSCSQQLPLCRYLLHRSGRSTLLEH